MEAKKYIIANWILTAFIVVVSVNFLIKDVRIFPTAIWIYLSIGILIVLANTYILFKVRGRGISWKRLYFHSVINAGIILTSYTAVLTKWYWLERPTFLLFIAAVMFFAAIMFPGIGLFITSLGNKNST